MKTLNITNVLVPVDFSSTSVRAIESARQFASRFGASLHLVHVHDFYYPLGWTPAPIGLPAAVPDCSIMIAEQTEQRLRRDLERVGAVCEIPASRCHVRRGAPVFDEICRCAREIGADLIVTPTHGRSGLKQVLLGSTAERLVQHSPYPVLVIKANQAAAMSDNPTGRIDRILVPVDFSRRSMAGLQFAIQLARKFSATITVLHVVNLGYALTADGYAMYDLSRFQEIARDNAEKEMTRFLRAMKFDGVKFNSQVVTDIFLDGLNGTIRKQDIDLVVTTTHGRTGLSHLVMGSIAELIVRRAACPVLVVPSHPAARLKTLVVERRPLATNIRRTPTPLSLSGRPGGTHSISKRFRKLNSHPFPERRKTNKFRETHQMVTK